MRRIMTTGIEIVVMLLALIYYAGGVCERCHSYPSHPAYPELDPDNTSHENIKITPDPLDELVGDEDITQKLTASIISPFGYPHIYEEGPINFEAFVFGGTPPYRFEWVSNIDGVIGRDREFTIKNLSVNTHEITLKVRDSTGLEVRENISLVVIKKIPLTVSILSPKNTTYLRGDFINLIPSVYGGKKPYTLIWKLDGKKLDKDITRIGNLSVGIHKITLEVIDFENISVKDTIEVIVIETCNKNGVCDHGENYWNCPEDCSGSRDNYCDGIRDGICDPDCHREGDIDCICNNDNICEMGIENYLNCPQDCASGGEDGYCDKVEDGKCDPDCKSGEDPDCMKVEWLNYLILLIFVIILVAGYFKFIRK